MKRLTDREWLTKYSPESGDLVADFYVPALECAVRYPMFVILSSRTARNPG